MHGNFRRLAKIDVLASGMRLVVGALCGREEEMMEADRDGAMVCMPLSKQNQWQIGADCFSGDVFLFYVCL